MNASKSILPIIVLAQFLCTSLWFAGNGVILNLSAVFSLDPNALANLTSAVQFGFIIGTLLFAFFMFADRFSPSKVFAVCALFGAVFNLGLIYRGNSIGTILFFRGMTGFFLAGIYPVGMKIAADYFDKGLGKSLGFLVGALVLGTALPHLLKEITDDFSWRFLVVLISCLSLLGGILMLTLVPDGPYRKRNKKLALIEFFKVFEGVKFRQAVFGYFGHMWELYAFWTFVPVVLQRYVNNHKDIVLNISFWSFSIIAIGSLSCIAGGYLAHYFGVKKIAKQSLLLSCLCCCFLPIMYFFSTPLFFVVFLLFWGMVVIADSPLFSTLVANNAPSELKGTALTIVNCLGFSITIVSIQLIQVFFQSTNSIYVFLLMAVGPILGLLAVGGKRRVYRVDNQN